MKGATAILVAGMHRSGTSALAGALNLLGVPLGQHLLEPGPDNPKGYWEHRDIVVVHERLLAALGSRWDDVRALPEGWLTSAAAARAAAAIGELVVRDFSGKPLWAVKDPRLCRFLPLWFQVLGQQGIRPVVLFMVRSPDEVAASIEARNHWRAPIGQMLWLRYVTEAATASRNVPRSVVVYDELLAAPAPAVARALTRLKVELASPTASARRDLAGFIDRADRHHLRGAQEYAADRFGEIAHAAYSALQSIARDGDAWAQLDQARSDLDEYWQRHGGAMNALADMSARLAINAESEWVESRRLASQLDAQLQWSEQAVKKQESLQAANADLSSKLAAQIQWSQRATQKHEALQAANADLSSKLTAQIQWSQQATQKHEALQAASADLSSKLAAQIQWSQQATQKHEALQADNADLSSKLAAQINWSEQAQQRIEALQEAQADLQSKLATQVQCTEQVTRQRDALQAELAQTAARLAEHARDLSDIKTRLNVSESARRELAATHQEAMDGAERLRKQLLARLDTSQREYEILDGQFAALRQRRSELEAELQAVYASRSWRMTRPFRRVAGVFGAKAPPDGNDKRNAK